MINTIRNVTIVVKLLMINCQCSEKRKTGPLAPQISRMASAPIMAHDVPAA
jgi:hypothetical protein